MRSIKTMLLLVTVGAVVSAVLLPAVASAADWKKNGSAMTNTEVQWADNGAPLSSEATATFSGGFSFSGGVNCSTVNGEMTLEPGYGTGRVTEMAFTPSSCVTSGTLKAIGCTKVSSVNPALPKAYFATNGSRELRILNAQITYNLEGGSWCPKSVTISGDVTATPDNSKGIGSLTFSGIVSSTLGPNVTTGGTVSVSPAGRYGIISTETVDLSGTIIYSGYGSVCQVTGGLALEPGGKGSIYDMDWAGCELTGTLKHLGCSSLSSVTTYGMPWAIENTGSEIQVTDMKYTMYFSGTGTCPKSMTVEGDPTLVPNNAAAISSTELKGWMQSSFGTSLAIGGGFNWSPAGTYGL